MTPVNKHPGRTSDKRNLCFRFYEENLPLIGRIRDTLDATRHTGVVKACVVAFSTLSLMAVNKQALEDLIFA